VTLQPEKSIGVPMDLVGGGGSTHTAVLIAYRIGYSIIIVNFSIRVPESKSTASAQ